MINQYDYIKSEEDKLYLRVNNLLRELMSSLTSTSRLEAYSYLRDIYFQFFPNSTINYTDYIKAEKFLLSPHFLNNKCFNDLDKEKMMAIIREYKINGLFNTHNYAKDII